jgi:hypothetical protein
MRSTPILLGMFLAAGIMVGIAVSQSETKFVDGQPQRVVATMRDGQAVEIPLNQRCVWLGVSAGLVGAGIGYFASNGGNFGAAFLGGLILGGLAAGWRAEWDDHFGKAGKNAQVSDSWMSGLVGGLLGAAAAWHFPKHERYPRRLPPSEPADALGPLS